MFEILRLSLKAGIVTTTYPRTPPEISGNARGRPDIDWVNWKDARPAAVACPTGAIAHEDGTVSASPGSTWRSASSAAPVPTWIRPSA